jgi:hypothetical protein
MMSSDQHRGGSMRLTRRSRAGRPLRRFALIVAIAGVALTSTLAASAQSPAPGSMMFDSRPGNGWPPNAGAAVVEGLGSIGGCAYSESSIESQTVSWINQGHWVVTEISPQSTCGTIAAYESLLVRIKNYVQANATAPGSHWAGFMLDEESGYGFSASQLTTLNQYVESFMVNVPGMSWYFTEDFPNGSNGSWSLATWNTLLANSWPAPQVYNSYMITFTNNECSTYNNCTNNITVNSNFASPWNSPSWVTSQINGSPWSNGYWNSSLYWYNLYRNQ